MRMVKWLAALSVGSLILIMIPMALSAQASGSYDAGLGVVFELDPLWSHDLDDILTIPPGNDQIIMTGTQQQTGSSHGDIPIMAKCGLSPVPTGTPAPTPTGTPAPTPTSTPCSPFDIYIHIVLAANWTSPYSQSHIEIDLNYGTGGAINGGSQLGAIVIPCTIDTPYSGSCALDTYVKLNSASINWQTDRAQAYVEWINNGGGGGVAYGVNYMVTFADKDLSPAMANCDSQFLTGSTPIASGTVDAENSMGVNILRESTLGLNIGDWIEVVISGGPWQLNGTGDYRYDMATKTEFTTWGELSGTGVSKCAVYPGMGSYVKAYLQVTSTNNISFRVNANEFVLNSGSLNYTVYKATYSPFPANGCAEKYAVQNNIGSITVSANASNGIEFTPPQDLNSMGYPVGPTEGENTRFIAIVTSGTYYTVTNGGSGTGALKDIGTGDTWESMATDSEATCISKLDPIGHYMIYIPFTGQAVDFLVRANTISYSGQPGQLTFTFYIATKIQVQTPPVTLPATGSCDTYFTHSATLFHTYTVTGAYYAGSIMTLDPSKYYALQVTGGPWLNNGTTSSYDMAISDDDGATWSKIWSYGSALCSALIDSNHSITYIKPLTGRIYRIRVYDPDNNYSDGNTGSLSLNVYEATPTGQVSQWDTCGSSYTLVETNSPDSSRHVPANLELGVPFGDNTIGSNLTLTPGSIYAIDVDPAYGWKELTSPLTLRFQYQISADGGTTWATIDDSSYAVPGLLCVMHTTAGIASPYRIYFTARDGSYRIRAHDQNGIWADNLDYMIYRLYKVTNGGTGTPPGSEPPTPPSVGNWPGNPAIWGPGCTDVCQRPSSLIALVKISFTLAGSPISFNVPVPDVAGWFEYGRCSLQHYISWCQEDTQAILNIPNSLKNKEPFGTFIEVETAITNVQKVIASYNITGGAGTDIGPNTSSLWGPITGGSSSSGDGGSLLSNLPVTSFWNGGPLNLTAGGAISATDTDYINQCTTSYTKYIGNPAYSMCYALVIIKNLTGFLQKIQWLIDIIAAIMIVSYVMTKWVGAGGPPN